MLRQGKRRGREQKEKGGIRGGEEGWTVAAASVEMGERGRKR